MTTFHSVIYGIIYGFSQFLPISADAHAAFLPALLGWPTLPVPLLGAPSLSGFLALFIYFRHDWASLISSILQVIIFRRRPTSIDERLPIFILLACLPLVMAWYYLHDLISGLPWTPTLLALTFIALGAPLWFLDSYSRKNKTMSDWNWTDSLLIGLAQTTMLIPGAGFQTGAMTASLSRNYNREAAAKFSFFLGLPILGVLSIAQLRGLDLHASVPAPDLSWTSFWIASFVCFFSSLLAIGGLMKNIQRNKNFRQYSAYRLLLGVAVIGVTWYRSR